MDDVVVTGEHRHQIAGLCGHARPGNRRLNVVAADRFDVAARPQEYSGDVVPI
jgi:hypothetical protein